MATETPIPVTFSVSYAVQHAACRHCGQRIMSVDGWIHEVSGLAQCTRQPAPLVAEPDWGACA
jgi:hypothetical protein